MAITFQSEDVEFTLKNKQVLRRWISFIAASGNFKAGPVNYIFCSDEHLLSINKQYLNHDFYTDIITFDYTEGGKIAGDIFISVDRVKDNAKEYKTTFEKELHRVIIHGILHLMGNKDKTKAEEKSMRELEEYALGQLAV